MSYTWTHAPSESFVRENLCLLELLVGGAIFGISRLAAVLPHPLPPLSHGLLLCVRVSVSLLIKSLHLGSNPE